jgi:hypothetical protein
MLLWLNGSKSQQHVPTSSGKSFQKSGGWYSSKGGTNFIVACVHIFGHVVYVDTGIVLEKMQMRLTSGGVAL